MNNFVAGFLLEDVINGLYVNVIWHVFILQRCCTRVYDKNLLIFATD